ncbi:MAG: SagB/ThcOx family dehydrogenase [Halolamina sp.]|uniref:SagB/ThcOx family dehydrogenase n=1 Tax=Halolamina sp. TaxID=1940283 RepID=UPI002FC2ACE6
MTDTISARKFHERTKLPPDDGYDRRTPANLPQDHKAYVDLPRQPLSDRIRPPQVPALAALSDGNPNPESPATRTDIDRETLTQLCYHAAGITSVREGERTIRFRAASCTGALYHIDLYPVVGENGPIPAGVYHFDPLTCSVDVLREGDFRGVLADASGRHERVGDAPVTFVTTSTWWRNAWKYSERTYRHAFWDSGTVLANLLAVAHAQDLPAEAVLGFADQRVAALLGVDIDDEAPLELVPVGAGNPAPEAREMPNLSPETEPLSPNPKQYPLITEAYRGSVLADGAAARAWREAAAAPRERATATHPTATQGKSIPLDPVGDDRASKAPLPVSIRRRRSHREYAPTPLNFRKFSTVLDRAVRSQPLDATPGDDPLALLDCYLIINAVEGLESGSYQYHPGAGELEQLRSGQFREAATQLALSQEWAGDAAVGVYFMADLDAVVGRLGNRGYRAAQLEAGLLGGRLYLATYAHRDLAGLGLTFRDDAVTEFFEPRAAGTTPMFHYVFGRPA